MRKISNNDLNLLKQLCRLPQEELLQLTAAFLYKHYEKVVATVDYVYAEGDIPVCLVAHLDTVFSTPPQEIYYDREAGIMWSPDGLGADDRAGVFAIIKIIQNGYKPHVIFTTDEEWGGIGASWLIHDYPICPFNECNFLLELDRRDTNDACFYDCVNEDFIDFIEKFGYYDTVGIYSDIVELCPVWGMAGVNLSVGYTDEHDKIERLNVPALMRTIDATQQILETPSQKFIWEGSDSYYKALELKMLGKNTEFELMEI